MSPSLTIAHKTDTAETNAIFLSEFIQAGPKLSGFANFDDLRFCQFVQWMLRADVSFAPEFSVGMFVIFGGREIFKILYSIISFPAISVIDLTTLRLGANKCCSHEDMNSETALVCFPGKPDSKIAAAGMFWAHDSTVYAISRKATHAAQVGNIIAAFIAKYLSPLFFHDFNCKRAMAQESS